MTRASTLRGVIRIGALVACAAVVVAAAAGAAGAQVVGRLPTESVLRDVSDPQRFGVFTGWLTTSLDPVGVRGHSAPMVGVRYDVLMGSPAYFSMRAFAVKSEHDVVNPNLPSTNRVVGTASNNQLAFDASIHLSLTGARSWHGVQPLVHLGIGAIAGVANHFDEGKYAPGASVLYSYGLATRFPTGKNGEFRADFGWLVYQMRYPTAFRTTTAVNDVAPRAEGSMTPLTFNRAITVSWSWGIFR